MKTSFVKTMIVAFVLLSTTINAQIKNAKTEVIKVYGNCGMCETNIEKAGNSKKTAKVDWNQETQMATITYDTKKTNTDEILKKIALSGYDSDKFLAPDDVYNNLHGCCQYDRVAKVPVKEIEPVVTSENHENHEAPTEVISQKENQLKSVFDNYFKLKDALITSDDTATAAKSSLLLASINAVQMDKLDMDVHMVWMKVLNQIKEDSEHIAETNDIKHQRDHFMTLSKEIYSLMKVSKSDVQVYYQFCPMANGGKGANWLSKENEIKNPYYGSMMLTCGKTVETIK